MSQSATISTETDNTPNLRPYLVLVMGIMAVSMAAIFIRLAQGAGVPSIVIAASRLAIAAIILTPITLRRYGSHFAKLSGTDIILLLISGIFLALHFAAWVSSLEYTSVLISVIVVTTTPIWVGLMEVFILKARLSRGIIVGLVIAMTGGLLIALSGDSGTAMNGNNMLGGFLSLIGALAVAVYLIIGRKMRSKLPLLPYIWMVYGFAALILMVILLFTNQTLIGYSIEGYIWVLALGLIPQLIGHSSLNYALGYLPATYVSLATQAEPILSAILAFFLFGELPAELQILGSAIILVGVTIATLSPPSKKTKGQSSDAST